MLFSGFSSPLMVVFLIKSRSI